MIASPGTGVQHRASFMRTSSVPSTSTALLDRLVVGARLGKTSIVGSGCESSAPIEATSLSIIDAAETCPSPTAEYRPSISEYRRSCANSRSECPAKIFCRGKPAFRICRAIDSRPASIASSRRSLLNQALILERALGLFTKLSQSRLGPAASLLLVTISTTSPLLRRDSRGTSRPFTFAPAHLRPTSVWTENAKSTGVDPPGKATTLPLGVKTKTSGEPKSKRSASRNSEGSSVSFCHSWS